MTKKYYRIYLDTSSYEKLKEKARESGIESKAWFSAYLNKIAQLEFVFLDSNAKSMLKFLKIEVKK